MYRDRSAGSEIRIAYLEQRVREQTEENRILRYQLAGRNQAVFEVVHAAREELAGRERQWRAVAIATTILALAAMLVTAAIVVLARSQHQADELAYLPELPSPDAQKVATPHEHESGRTVGPTREASAPVARAESLFERE